MIFFSGTAVGEENTNTDEERKSFIEFFKDVDPYNHPVVVHTRPIRPYQEEVYIPLLGYPRFDGASVHSLLEENFNDVLHWIQQSAAANHRWVVSNDEQGPNDYGVVPDMNDTEHNSIRKEALWGTIMAGGAYVHRGVSDCPSYPA